MKTRPIIHLIALMRSRFVVLSVLAAIVILSAGCVRPTVPEERLKPAPLDLAMLKQRSDYWHDCQARMRVAVDSKTTKFNARAIVLVKGTDFVRFETFAPFGQTATLYVSNEAGPALLIPSEKALFTAQRPETLTGYFLGASLPFDVFRHALTASIPSNLIDSLQTRIDSGVLHASSSAGNRFFDWQFAPDGSTLQAVYIRQEGFEGRISYEPPVLISSDATPKKIRLTSADWSMDITIEEMQASPEFQPSAFLMPNIPGVRKVDLDKIQ